DPRGAGDRPGSGQGERHRGRGSADGDGRGDAAEARRRRRGDHEGLRALLPDGRDPAGTEGGAGRPAGDAGPGGGTGRGHGGRSGVGGRAGPGAARVTLDRTWLLATAESERTALGRTIQYTE